MSRMLFFFLCLFFLSKGMFAAGDGAVDIQKNDPKFEALASYVEIWKQNKYSYEKDAQVVRTMPMDVVKKHILEVGNWEFVAQHLYKDVRDLVMMMNKVQKEIPKAYVAMQEYFQEKYLFDQFEELESFKFPQIINKIARLTDLLEKAKEGSIVIVMLDGLVFDADGDELLIVAPEAKEVIDTMLAKGIAVFGYTNTGFAGVSRVASFLENNQIHFSKIGKTRSLQLEEKNQGVQDGIFAGQSLLDIVSVFSNINEEVNLIKGADVPLFFVTDKDVVAHKIREDAPSLLEANVSVIQCTYIANQSHIEEIANANL